MRPIYSRCQAFLLAILLACAAFTTSGRALRGQSSPAAPESYTIVKNVMAGGADSRFVESAIPQSGTFPFVLTPICT